MASKRPDEVLRMHVINPILHFCACWKIHFPCKHMTLIQRLLNVDATSWRCIDVGPTLFKRHVPAGSLAATQLQVSYSAMDCELLVALDTASENTHSSLYLSLNTAYPSRAFLTGPGLQNEGLQVSILRYHSLAGTQRWNTIDSTLIQRQRCRQTDQNGKQTGRQTADWRTDRERESYFYV